MARTAYSLSSGKLTQIATNLTPQRGTPIWPTASTTGVQPGVTLTNYTGGQTVAAGTYENVLFPNIGTFYTFSPSTNAIIRNCRFLSGATFNGCDSLLFENCEAPGISFSSCHGVTARGLNLSNSTDDFIGVAGDSSLNRPDNRCLDIVIENSYIHNPNPAPTAHTDGVQARGVSGLTIRNCYFDLGTYRTELNAAIFLENANGGNSNILIQNNYLNGGSYTLMIATHSGTLELVDNILGPNAQYGAFTLTAPAPSYQRGNKLASNGQTVTFVVNN